MIIMIIIIIIIVIIISLLLLSLLSSSFENKTLSCKDFCHKLSMMYNSTQSTLQHTRPFKIKIMVKCPIKVYQLLTAAFIIAGKFGVPQPVTGSQPVLA